LYYDSIYLIIELYYFKRKQNAYLPFSVAKCNNKRFFYSVCDETLPTQLIMHGFKAYWMQMMWYAASMLFMELTNSVRVVINYFVTCYGKVKISWCNLNSRENNFPQYVTLINLPFITNYLHYDITCLCWAYISTLLNWNKIHWTVK
jgi:hypothetical protein